VSHYSIPESSTEAIYRQLADQLRRRIAAGQLKAGEELSSVRDLAQSLAINPMTVSKAFGVLVSEGLLERRRGRSMVVANLNEGAATAEARVAMMRPLLERAAAEAGELGVSDPAVLALFRVVLKERRASG